MNIFEVILVQPFINLLVIIYTQLHAMHIAGALGFSIILLSFLIRLLLYPIMQQSMMQQKKMQEAAPELNKIKEKYKGDMQKQQAAQMELFKKIGYNPLAGCLPMLLQIPILIALYQVLLKAIETNKLQDINHYIYTNAFKLPALWDKHFMGILLSQKPQEMMTHLPAVAIAIVVITGGLQLIQSKMMSPKNADKPKPKPGAEPDFSTMMQSQMLFLLPLMIGFFAYSFPFGISLYWNTLTIFGIIQQYMTQGWGGLSDWLPFLETKKEKTYFK